jgi:glutathione S-transferase
MNSTLRARTRIFIHAAEGTVTMHSMAFFAFRMGMPQRLREMASDDVEEAERKMAVHVQKDLDWLERELETSTGAFLVGDTVTAADIMLYISALFTLKFELGTKGRTWPAVEAWLKRCEDTESYKRAVEKSGFHM